MSEELIWYNMMLSIAQNEKRYAYIRQQHKSLLWQHA